MLFSVDQQTLQDALSVASLGVGTEKGSHRNKLLFEVEADRITIRSTDDTVFVFVPFEADEVEETENFMINADAFNGWVKTVEGDIEISREDEDIVARCGDIVSHFVRYKPINFPDLADKAAKADTVLDVPSDRLEEAFKFSRPLMEDVDDGTSARAWKSVTELWDGEMIASNVKAVSCIEDSILTGEPVELDETEASTIRDCVDTYMGRDPEDVLNTEGDTTTVLPNALHRVFEETSAESESIEDWDLYQNYTEGKYAPLRVSVGVLSDLLTFMSKTGGIGVKIARHDRTHVVEADDGSVFGFLRSQHQMPDLLDVLYGEPIEEHRWEVDTDELMNAVKGLASAAASDTESITLEFSDDGSKLNLFMPSEAGPDSEYPVEINAIEGCEGVTFKIGQNRLTDVVDQYNSSDLEFALDIDEPYLKIANYPEDVDEDEEPEPLKYTQVVLKS